jgi:hypothetical protein
MSVVALIRTLLGALVLMLWACGNGSTISTALPEKKLVSAEASLPSSPWNVSTDRNELTGETTVTAVVSHSRDGGFIVRQRGKQLDCYVTTGEFLETVENMHSRLSGVGYKFDEGPIVRESWIISDDNVALFIPGNPTSYLKRMRKAKRFVIEYHSTDKIPQTMSFDVSSFPSEIQLDETKPINARKNLTEEERLNQLNEDALSKRNAAIDAEEKEH